MGPYRTAALIIASLVAAPIGAQEPGWHYSPLPGEGDRASLGCSRETTAQAYTCLAVRCEDDFSTGIHIHTSGPGGAAGRWEMTLDRETRMLDAVAENSPYGARLADPGGWLLDGLRHGTFVYLRHAEDENAAFDYISLAGSFSAIADALYWCAPRLSGSEQIAEPGVEPLDD